MRNQPLHRQLLQLKCVAFRTPPSIRQQLLRGLMAYPSRASPTIDPEAEAIIAASMKAKAKPKQRPRSLDPARRMKADPRDPRTSVDQWPCYNQHTPAPPQSNQGGQWIVCQCCNLRLLYTPRKGAPANTTATVNAATVTRMLTELHQLLGETRPTATICHHATNKITAEIVLHKAVRDLKSGQSGGTGSTNPPAATSTSTSPMSTTWGMVPENDEELIQAYENEISGQ